MSLFLKDLEKIYRLDTLEALTGGDVDEMKVFVSQFVEDITYSIEKIKTDLPRRAIVDLKFQVHRLRPSVINLHIDSLVLPLQLTEDSLADGICDDDVIFQLTFVVSTLQNVVADLKHYPHQVF